MVAFCFGPMCLYSRTYNKTQHNEPLQTLMQVLLAKIFIKIHITLLCLWYISLGYLYAGRKWYATICYAADSTLYFCHPEPCCNLMIVFPYVRNTSNEYNTVMRPSYSYYVNVYILVRHHFYIETVPRVFIFYTWGKDTICHKSPPNGSRKTQTSVPQS